MSRTILITGATGKLGKVFVRHFTGIGDQVIAIGRSKDALLELGDSLSVSQKYYPLVIDLIDLNFVKSLMLGLDQLGLEPDSVINNARSLSSLRVGELGITAREDFLAEFSLGVIVPYELVMALAFRPFSKLRSVVNIGSIYGSVAPNQNLYEDPVRQSPIQYGVSKAAVAHLSKELAVRLAPKGIRVNCVALGGVEGRADERLRSRYASLCPAGRMLTEDEVSGPVDMLLSQYGAGVSGHVLLVDGGWTAW